MGIFDWLFGNKKKSPEEKLTEHLKREREKSIPKHRGNKPVRLQPRVVGTNKEADSITKKTLLKEKNKKNVFSNDSLKAAVKEWLDDISSAEKKYGHISGWNVSKVSDMGELFCEAESFNEDIGNWDVSNVKNMSHIFFCADAFNQDLSKWNVSSVKNMWRAFYSADNFNQDIGNWDVSKVENMSEMFERAGSFNQDISKWDVSNVTDMQKMFMDADTFNQDIGQWDVSKVKDMSGMFFRLKIFNQDISKWDVSKVENMSEMFCVAESFNQDIGNWDVSNVTDMNSLFNGAKMFNQDIGQWDVSKVENMYDIFKNCELFKQDLSKWDLKGMVSNLEETVKYLNSFSATKIKINAETKTRLKERGEKKIEITIDNVKISTTLHKFENVITQDYAVEDYDDDYNVYLTSSHDEVCNLLNDITDQALVVIAEHWANIEELGEINIEEVAYLNCECPETLKKYYNGDLFISYRGKLLDVKSDDYKKINFDEIWENSEISNSGVVCEDFSEYLKHI